MMKRSAVKGCLVNHLNLYFGTGSFLMLYAAESWRSAVQKSRRIRFAIERTVRQSVPVPEKSAQVGSSQYLEAMESRVLLSAYTLSQLGYFGINAGGSNPRSTLIADSSGNLYGTASGGGTYGYGTVFDVAKGSSAITTLVSFNDANGADPFAGLTLDASGNFYGTTYSGGAYGGGTVFEIASGSTAITTLASFDGSDGLEPYAGVTMDASGNLYGTTQFGGANNDGTVFEIASGSTAITVLASFNGTNGARPQAGVTLDAAGNLFGTTSRGGSNSWGTIYEIAGGSNAITALSSFAAFEQSESTMLLDASGNLYGAAGNNSEGLIFEIAAASTTATTVAAFNGANGSQPYGGLTMDNSGDLLGTTFYGSSNDGNVFEIASGSTAITSLATFTGTNGRGPMAGITIDSSGNLYGTTEYGGTNDTGAVFEIPKSSTAAVAIASFNSVTGAAPTGGLTRDSSGNFYGTTSRGGAYNDGTAFEIANGSNAITTIATFNQTNGSSPEGALTMDPAGNLYGTTYSGGANSRGTVFEIAKGSNAITTLGSFNGTSQGNFPNPTLTMDSGGNLYGTTMAGGSSSGTIFEIAKGSKMITTLNDFPYSSPNRSAPTGGLTLDSLGNLYGIAASGGANGSGAIFEIAHGTTALTTLASFNATTSGFNPSGTLLMDAAGNLYGTAASGGVNNEGTLFELAKGSRAIATLAAFNGANGAAPRGGLILDSSGNLFGTTPYGGSFNNGTVFEIARGSAEITTLESFSFADGAPASGLVLDSLGDLYDTSANGGGTAFELTPNTAVTLTTQAPNPSSAGQALSLTAAVSGGVPDGETVTLEDASNNYAVLATATTSNGSATLIIPVGTLLAGTHNLVAIYGGDANFAASESTPYAQVVQVAVTGVTVNGNLPTLAGVQRSMVDSIVYTFSEAVNVEANAFDIAVHAGQTGTVPTLNWAALNPNTDGSSSQWVVTFNGAGVSGGSIADGVYDITLNAGTVTSDANPSVSSQSRPTDTFYRLFGDAQGTGKVNSADYDAFLSTYGLKSTSAGYLAYFADDGTTKIDSSDYDAFLYNYGKKLSGFTATI